MKAIFKQAAGVAALEQFAEQANSLCEAAGDEVNLIAIAVVTKGSVETMVLDAENFCLPCRIVGAFGSASDMLNAFYAALAPEVSEPLVGTRL